MTFSLFVRFIAAVIGTSGHEPSTLPNVFYNDVLFGRVAWESPSGETVETSHPEGVIRCQLTGAEVYSD